MSMRHAGIFLGGRSARAIHHTTVTADERRFTPALKRYESSALCSDRAINSDRCTLPPRCVPCHSVYSDALLQRASSRSCRQPVTVKRPRFHRMSTHHGLVTSK